MLIVTTIYRADFSFPLRPFNKTVNIKTISPQYQEDRFAVLIGSMEVIKASRFNKFNYVAWIVAINL